MLIRRLENRDALTVSMTVSIGPATKIFVMIAWCIWICVNVADRWRMDLTSVFI